MGAYNDASREVTWKIEIYLDGPSNDPLVATRDDLLISAHCLHEAVGSGNSIIDTFKSDEISFVMYNDGRFTPTNKTGPYYGKIKKGVMIKGYSRPSFDDDEPWDKLGTFYVTDWQTTVTGATATVTANDTLYNVIEKPMPVTNVRRNIGMKDYILYVAAALECDIQVTEAIAAYMLSFAYQNSDNHKFLSDLMNACLSWLVVDRLGQMKVINIVEASRANVRHIFRDDDQIISVDAAQGISTDYDGACVVANIPSESEVMELVNISSYRCRAGNEIHQVIDSDATPINRICGASIVGVNDVYVDHINATQSTIVVTTQNDEMNEKDVNLVVTGTIIKTTPTTYTDDGDDLLGINSKYIQSRGAAEEIKGYLTSFVANKLPFIEVRCKGDPLVEIGDKVQVISAMYNLDFTGIVVRNQLDYSGYMTGTLTLINAEIFN